MVPSLPRPPSWVEKSGLYFNDSRSDWSYVSVVMAKWVCGEFWVFSCVPSTGGLGSGLEGTGGRTGHGGERSRWWSVTRCGGPGRRRPPGPGPVPPRPTDVAGPE